MSTLYAWLATAALSLAFLAALACLVISVSAVVAGAKDAPKNWRP